MLTYLPSNMKKEEKKKNEKRKNKAKTFKQNIKKILP
jgi:radical SAM superfamily enzyme with C-terminal helix-hairpin-helix motif